jgi:hypothetical protein
VTFPSRRSVNASGISAGQLQTALDDAAKAMTEAANVEAAQAGQPTPSPETLERTRHVLLSYGQEGARMLWLDPDDCVFSSFTMPDGSPEGYE